MSASGLALKRLADIRFSSVDKHAVAGEQPVRLCNYVDVFKNEEITKDMPLMEGTATLEELRRFGLEAGDVLITKDSETPDEIGIPAFVPDRLDGVVCGYHLAILRPNRDRIDPRYLYWALVSDDARRQFSSRAMGITRFGLRQAEVGGATLPVPSLDRQQAIADFLNSETGRVDALIKRRESLVELLGARWKAEIYRAVTKGLSSDVPLIESGIAWAGKMPAHWSTPPLYAHFDVQLGKMLNPERAAGPNPAPYLRNTNVQWDRFDLADLATMSFSEEDRAKYALRSGDLLVCEGGEVGRAAIWKGELEECYYQKAVHRVRPRENSNARFLMYALWAAASMNVFAVEGNQATIVHLTAEQLRARRFPMPPPSEQDAIVRHLDRRKGVIERTLDSLARQVALLREHRQALITAAVTGMIRIPDSAA